MTSTSWITEEWLHHLERDEPVRTLVCFAPRKHLHRNVNGAEKEQRAHFHIICQLTCYNESLMWRNETDAQSWTETRWIHQQRIIMLKRASEKWHRVRRRLSRTSIETINVEVPFETDEKSRSSLTDRNRSHGRWTAVLCLWTNHRERNNALASFCQSAVLFRARNESLTGMHDCRLLRSKKNILLLRQRRNLFWFLRIIQRGNISSSHLTLSALEMLVTLCREWRVFQDKGEKVNKSHRCQWLIL